MGQEVSEKDVRHVAALARLGLDPAKVQQLVKELNGILAHMDVLSGVDTSRQPAFVAQQLEAMFLRADEPGTSTPLTIPRERFAPEMRDGFFLVPRLATHEDEG
jgi:aspartyl-tRNA(Asn)/glutamyl-tRNA(Gln) amidotransferase subunit C